VNSSTLVLILAAGVQFGTGLLFPALGELLAERTGVLNLGVQGMMLMGGTAGFWAAQKLAGSGSFVALTCAIAFAALVGALTALVHAFLVITLRVNQIVSGLALTITFGSLGLAAFVGDTLSLAQPQTVPSFKDLDVLGLRDVPIVGPIVFSQNLMVYVGVVATALTWWYLAKTRPGLDARAVGETPGAADALGIDVARVRYAHTLLGGALAGVGGAYYALALLQGSWTEDLTSGDGWIAVALVVFAFWRPELTLVGAYLFGALKGMSDTFQAKGIDIVPIDVLTALPFLMTIVVLVIASVGFARQRLGAPAALGIPYVREER
jgi:general nucleoside transport system permease protein